jgi:hypothetical protein
MLYYLHLLLAPIYSLVSSLLLRDQNREILLLRQQLLILRRQLSRKPAYGRLEKLSLLLGALRLSTTVLRPTFSPSFNISPWIFLHPQWGFS